MRVQLQLLAWSWRRRLQALVTLLVAAALLGVVVTPAHAAAAYTPATDVGSLYNTTLMTGTQQYWKAGLTGKGVDVAVIDSGVAPVPGLDGTDKLYHGPDVSFEAQVPELAHHSRRTEDISTTAGWRRSRKLVQRCAQ